LAANSEASDEFFGIVSLGDSIYFIGTNGNNGEKATLWKLDPTTYDVSEVTSSSYSYYRLTVLGDKLYFYSGDELGGGLWTSDGTAAGTQVVDHFRDPSATANPGIPGELYAAADQIFMAAGDGIHGTELWTSDGTEAGTHMLKDLLGGTAYSRAFTPVVIGDTAYFFADDGIHGMELWKSNGTAEGTSLLADITPGQNPFGGYPIANLNGDLLFRMDPGLWRTDGTAEGTHEIRGMGVHLEAMIGDLLYFRSPVGAGNQGWELWRSDGTTEGTFLISDLRLGNQSSDIVNYVGFKGEVYFTADDGTGYELWKTNGEQGNVQQVSSFATGGRMGAVQEFGGSLYFTRLIAGHQLELWKTDGNWETASIVTTIDSPSFNVVTQWLATPDRLYFFNNETYVNGAWTSAELWTTDGTAPGTYMLRDEVSPWITDSQMNLRATLGGNVFFTADDGIHGVELWTSDGTVAGTHLVKDVRPGERGSDPTTPLVAGDQLYFSAIGPAGRELWRTDGTEAGTQQAADFKFGNSFSVPGAVFGGSLLVPAVGDRYGWEMWKVDLNDLPEMEAGAQSTFIENGGPVAVTPEAVVSDVDNTTFARGTFTAEITDNRTDGDVLSLRSHGSAAPRRAGGAAGGLRFGGVLIGSWSRGRGNKSLQVSFNAEATLPAVQAVLRGVTFTNTRDDITDGSRTVRYTFNDGDGPGVATFDAVVNVQGVNDAPVLNNSLDPRLTSIDEDAINPAGTQVLTLLKGAVTDADANALRGIAITAASELYGRWQYTLTGGQSWVEINEPTGEAALLLPGWARVRFLPNLNFNGTVKLWYRAWDQTAGTTGGTLNVLGGNAGGSKSVSIAGDSASLWVKPVNDAPVLDTTADPTLDPVWEDAKSPAGTLVSKFAAAAISDADAKAVKGIAVTQLDSENGKWQFSLNGGQSWQDFGFVSEGAARLLAADSLTKVRFIPNPDFDGQVTLTFRAWDRTEGEAGGTLGTSTRTGGQGTFSSAFDLATLTMVARNDRPVLSVGGSVGYVHNQAAVTLAPNATVQDVDSFDFDGGWLRVHLAEGADRTTRLLIGGEFTVDDDNNVLLGSAVIGTRTSNGWGTNDLLISFKPAATQVIVQQLVRSITFKTVFGGAGTRRVQFSLGDGDGGVSEVVEKTVNVT
jgi:ELWxxDGT repeat protein